jgi:hypothetical protein
VSYGLGIYMLNLGIGFLSPASDPASDAVQILYSFCQMLPSLVSSLSAAVILYFPCNFVGLESGCISAFVMCARTESCGVILHMTAQVLPTNESDEFRPFVRKLPEFKFWHSMTQGASMYSHAFASLSSLYPYNPSNIPCYTLTNAHETKEGTVRRVFSNPSISSFPSLPLRLVFFLERKIPSRAECPLAVGSHNFFGGYVLI